MCSINTYIHNYIVDNVFAGAFIPHVARPAVGREAARPFQVVGY